MRLTLTLLTSLIFITNTTPTQAYQVTTEHPRLWIVGQQGINDLKQRIQTNPSINERYQRMKDYAYNSDIDTANLWTIAQRVITIATVYLVENRDPELLVKLKLYADACIKAKPNSWHDAHRMKSLAFIYDWCFPDLTNADRLKYINSMKELQKLINSRWHHSDYNNHQYLEHGPFIYAGLAFYNDGIDDSAAKDLADWGKDFIYNHGIKTVNQVGHKDGDGGWHESRSYHAFFWYEMIQQWQAWYTATNENPFKLATALAGDPEWLVHTSRPHDSGAVGVADIHAYKSPYKLGQSNLDYLPLLATHYNNHIAQYLTQSIEPSRFDFQIFSYVLFYDPSITPQPPSSLPTARIFRGLGWTAMRSSWQKDATFALFVCANYYAGHQHSDQNQLLIHKLGNLAIDANQYGAKDTRFHNTILIGGSQRPFGNDPVRRYQPVEKLGPYDTGDIIAYENAEPHYTYVCGQAANAYPKGQVKNFTRQVVFCQPDIFIVFDRTDTPKPQPRHWLMHSLKPAKLTDNTITITDTDGKLFINMLLPESTTSSQEMLKGGNKDLIHNQITITPTLNNKTNLNFLTIIQASPAKSNIKPTCTLNSDSPPNTTSLTVSLGSKQWLLSFATKGPPAGTITIIDNNKTILTQPLTQSVAKNP